MVSEASFLRRVADWLTIDFNPIKTSSWPFHSTAPCCRDWAELWMLYFLPISFYTVLLALAIVQTVFLYLPCAVCADCTVVVWLSVPFCIPYLNFLTKTKFRRSIVVQSLQMWQLSFFEFVVFFHFFNILFLFLPFICPRIANIYAEYNQQDAALHNFFISVISCSCFRRVFRQSSRAQDCT